MYSVVSRERDSVVIETSFYHVSALSSIQTRQTWIHSHHCWLCIHVRHHSEITLMLSLDWF